MRLGDKIMVNNQGGRAVWVEVDIQIKRNATDYINTIINSLLWTRVMDKVGEISRYKVKI